MPLAATHDREALRNYLEEIKSLVDLPAQPPQPVPGSMSFQYGTPGTETNIETSFADIEAALYRPGIAGGAAYCGTERPTAPQYQLADPPAGESPASFEQDTNGMAAFIMDCRPVRSQHQQRRARDGYRPDETAHRVGDLSRSSISCRRSQRQLISDTLVINPTTVAPMNYWRLSAAKKGPTWARKSYLDPATAGPGQLLHHGSTTRPCLPASRPRKRRPTRSEALRTNPGATMQTTAEDMGTLLSMIHYCATGQGGACGRLPADDWQRECLEMLDHMERNKIGSLIEEGVPQDITIAHRHGWIGDTHVDGASSSVPAAITSLSRSRTSPNGWSGSSSAPLIADVRARRITISTSTRPIWARATRPITSV